MKRKLLMGLMGSLMAVAGVALGSTTASAHGERAQESFIRMETVGFWDTKFSQTTVNQGQDLTLSGTISWHSQQPRPPRRLQTRSGIQRSRS